jgi:hypothetical protein
LATKNVNILDTILKNQIQEDNIVGAIAVQIGLVDVLKSLELIPTAVYGDSWGKIVSSYYDDVITIEETVLTAYKINQKPSDFVSNALFNGTVELKEKMSKNSFVLNVSDQHLNNKDLLLAEGNAVMFLEMLGRYLPKSRL